MSYLKLLTRTRDSEDTSIFGLTLLIIELLEVGHFALFWFYD